MKKIKISEEVMLVGDIMVQNLAMPLLPHILKMINNCKEMQTAIKINITITLSLKSLISNTIKHPRMLIRMMARII